MIGCINSRTRRLAAQRSWFFATLVIALFSIPAKAGDGDAVMQFDTPDAAVKALMAAAKSGDKGTLLKIFGPVCHELVSGDAVQDKADFERFAKRLEAGNKLRKNDDGSITVCVGKTGHPFAIPLVQKDGKWHFDGDAGREELLNRRIGENELKTIAVCRGYVVAQRDYFDEDRDDDGVLEYAQKIASTAGRKDGLFWETTENEPASPLGPLVTEARGEGYAKRDAGDTAPRPYHGYLYRILTKQGDKAPGGKFDYVINGNMVAGFALVATPVQYGNSGIMTFVVNSNGRVFEKDLGEKSAEVVSAMQEYNPDATWKQSED